MINAVKNLGKKVAGGVKRFWNDEGGMGTVEVILIIVEKRVTGNTYVLCGN
ncbi:MAG: hypothetical protein IJJ64_12485 [Butyrivibrio sp.]|nr:hypothetical protein [Butyrivibrio sp.]